MPKADTAPKAAATPKADTAATPKADTAPKAPTSKSAVARMQRGYASTVVSLQSTAKVNIIIELCDLLAFGALNQLGSWQEEDVQEQQKAAVGLIWRRDLCCIPPFDFLTQLAKPTAVRH